MWSDFFLSSIRGLGLLWGVEAFDLILYPARLPKASETESDWTSDSFNGISVMCAPCPIAVMRFVAVFVCYFVRSLTQFRLLLPHNTIAVYRARIIQYLVCLECVYTRRTDLAKRTPLSSSSSSSLAEAQIPRARRQTRVMYIKRIGQSTKRLKYANKFGKYLYTVLCRIKHNFATTNRTKWNKIFQHNDLEWYEIILTENCVLLLEI